MCFDIDAQPPELPLLRRLAGGAAAERMTLEAGDGTSFSAAIAPSAASKGAGVVILPDVRGLFPFYERLAERFAEAGHDAIVLDWFGRTAGLGPRDEEFEFLPHVMAVEKETAHHDIKAAAEALRSRTEVTAVVTVGFCFGGTNSFVAGTNADLGLDGVIGFYGGLDPEGFGMKIPSPVGLAAETVVPVLGLFGGDDPMIPQERIDQYDAGLDDAGVPHDIHVYAGAPHSFFDRSFEQFADESADAWERVLDFLERVGTKAAA